MCSAGVRYEQVAALLIYIMSCCCVSTSLDVKLPSRDRALTSCSHCNASCLLRRDGSHHCSAGSEGGVIRADVFDWTVLYAGPKFDVLLACDVLYEA